MNPDAKRLEELEAISPFKLTTNELYELLELYGFTRGWVMKFKEYDYTIADHWLPALVNADYSGLEAGELEELEAFTKSLPGSGHWDFADDYPDFRIDDVSGMFANCVTAVYLVPVGGAS